MKPGPRRTAALVLALLVSTWGGPAPGQGNDAAAKARFAVTLMRFVQWPVSAAGVDAAPLRVCVLQNSAALANAFLAHEGASVGGRRVAVVLQLAHGAGGCDALFVDESGSAAAAALLADAAQRPILTLGAIDGFLAAGGMVEVVRVDDALRFDVDLSQLRRAGLGLSSQVLKLARRVRE
jgi:hypothetical protein